MKIGVITDCMKKPLDVAIKEIGALKFDGVQIYATTGTFSPDALTAQAKEEFKKLLSDNGLVVSALCGDVGGHGFEIEEDNALKIEKSKKIVDLAVEFNAKAVTTHIGVIPSDVNSEKFNVMLSALTELGLYAKERGVTFAIETGPEDAKTLLSFVSRTQGGVGVNLDPANFVMVTGQDPVEAVYMLKDYIVHTHLKDGKMLIKTDPKIIYDYFAEGGIEALNVADFFIETPVGEGDVDFVKYIQALKDIGYDGFLTIERETGADPAADILKAKAYIEKLI